MEIREKSFCSVSSKWSGFCLNMSRRGNIFFFLLIFSLRKMCNESHVNGTLRVKLAMEGSNICYKVLFRAESGCKNLGNKWPMKLHFIKTFLLDTSRNVFITFLQSLWVFYLYIPFQNIIATINILPIYYNTKIRNPKWFWNKYTRLFFFLFNQTACWYIKHKFVYHVNLNKQLHE